MSILNDWANRHAVTPAAMAELYLLMGFTPEVPELCQGKDESYVQSFLRLAGPPLGFNLARNNRGALPNERGVPIRFGLWNDTAALDKVCKSGDLVGYQSGWFRDYETAEPVKVAVFTMVECKHAGWPGFNPNDKREAAQQRCLSMVLSAGGIAAFSTGELPEGVRFPAIGTEPPRL